MLDTRIYLFTNDPGISFLFFLAKIKMQYISMYIVYHFILTPFITNQRPHTLFILTKYYLYTLLYYIPLGSARRALYYR